MKGKMMKIRISVPNDYGSDGDMSAAVQECYGGNHEAAQADECRECFDVLATKAKEAGLTFVESTDFGAEWTGTEAQCAAVREALPSWAYVSEIGE